MGKDVINTGLLSSPALDVGFSFPSSHTAFQTTPLTSHFSLLTSNFSPLTSHFIPLTFTFGFSPLRSS